MATMVDENDRTKTVGEMHNIQGWTKYVIYSKRWTMTDSQVRLPRSRREILQDEVELQPFHRC
jgi:hypothetical protein